MPDIKTQHDEIVEALGKKILEATKETYAPADLKTLAEAYEIARRAGCDY